MAHPQQLEFIQCVKQHLGDYFQGNKVLEIGSLDINGSIRGLFSDCDYTGVDVLPGEGVDINCEGQMLDLPSGHFDVVVSCEAMEHNPYWVETTANMFRMCRQGGLVMISCATRGRAEHGTQRTNPYDSPLTVELGWDYYKNLTERDFIRVFPLDRWFSSFRFFRNWNSYDLLFVGIRKGSNYSPDLTALFQGIQLQCACKGRIPASMHRRAMVFLFGDKGLYLIRPILAKMGLNL
jgi:SAM-dependent methyltransferase